MEGSRLVSFCHAWSSFSNQLGMGKGTEETLCYPGMLKDSSMVTGCLRDPRAVFMSSVRSRASLTEGPWQIPFFLAECLLSPNWGTLCGTTDRRERR